MKNNFDPYHKWLGIPPSEQPPNHYKLLGLQEFEDDPDVIEAAAERQMAYLHQINSGPFLAESQRLLNEVAAARVCLLDTKTKSLYDANLKTSRPDTKVNWKVLSLVTASLLLLLASVVFFINTRNKTSMAIIEDSPPGIERGRIERVKQVNDSKPVASVELFPPVKERTQDEGIGKQVSEPQKTIIGSPSLYALKFDGKSSYVQAPPVSVRDSGSLRIEAEVIVDAFPENGTAYVLSNLQSSGFGIAIKPDHHWHFFVHDQKTYLDLKSKERVRLGELYHLTGIAKGGQVSLFVNGELQDVPIPLSRGMKGSEMPLLLGADPEPKGRHRFFLCGSILNVIISREDADHGNISSTGDSSEFVTLYEMGGKTKGPRDAGTGNQSVEKIFNARWVKHSNDRTQDSGDSRSLEENSVDPPPPLN